MIRARCGTSRTAADGGEALIDEFVTGYYGGAAPHVREYMKAMEASVQATLLLHA